MSIRGPRFRYVLIVFGLLALAVGIYMMAFRTRGYEKATATVVSVQEIETADEDETAYDVTVKYTVNGKEYTELVDADGSKVQPGDVIDVLYDPANPARVKTPATGFGIYLLVVGVLLTAWGISDIVKEKRGVAALKEEHPDSFTYAPSIEGEPRKLYFLTDTMTAKYGHRIEDAQKRVLYEAKVTKFTLSAPTGMDFIDHEHGGRVTPHLVGHEETAEWNSLLIDNNSTFTFDGEDIWKHLKRNGIQVESSFQEGKVLWPQYRILRDGKEIAMAYSSSARVHEEDAGGALSKLVPARGYFRITTTEQNLDLLFVTLLAFARTEANDASGGNYGLLFQRKAKQKE